MSPAWEGAAWALGSPWLLSAPRVAALRGLGGGVLPHAAVRSGLEQCLTFSFSFPAPWPGGQGGCGRNYRPHHSTPRRKQREPPLRQPTPPLPHPGAGCGFLLVAALTQRGLPCTPTPKTTPPEWHPLHRHLLGPSQDGGAASVPPSLPSLPPSAPFSPSPPASK